MQQKLPDAHIKDLYEKFCSCDYLISTDSRNIIPGSIFFALPGDNFDGNQFASQAISAGARYAIVSNPFMVIDDKYILVSDTLVALQELSKFHRTTFSIPVICIGGSNGKTTSKELLGTVLSKKYITFMTQRNLNNHIGVPLSLLSLRKEHEIAVIEIGANHASEHTLLCSLVQPTHVVVTNNGKDHLEGFGSLEGVRKANSEIFYEAKKYNAIAFISIQHQDLVHDGKDAGLNIIEYGSDYTLQKRLSCSITYNDGLVINTQLCGDYNAENIDAAVTIGRYFEISDSDIQQALSEYRPSLLRSQILIKDTTTYVIDCYNANPSSMLLALQSFIQHISSNRILILGDMFELGAYSHEEHQSIIDFLTQYEFEEVILIGPEFFATKNLEQAHRFETVDSAQKFFSTLNIDNRTILLKASRGIGIERIINLK